MNQYRIVPSALALSLAALSFAQTVPDINRWTGGTALAPPAGHGMGNALTLTWGFVRDGNGISGGTSNLVSKFDATFGAGPGGNDLSLRPWFQHFDNSYQRMAAVSGLTMLYENADDGATGAAGSFGVRADMRIGGRSIDGLGGILAFNAFPNSGDMVIDTDDMSLYGNASNSHRFLRDVVMHESGHGFGCAHCESNNRGILMEPFINTSFDGPQLHDIMILQRGYGDRLEKTNGQLGNDTFANATGLGSIGIGGMFTIGNDARSSTVAGNAVDFVSIDDQSDLDFFTFNLSQAGTLDLTLEVLGDIYNIANQGGTQQSFNTFQRSDLTLTLLDGSGGILQTMNSSGLGGNEFISSVLNAGSYGIRISGLDNPDSISVDTQFYALTGSLSAVPEPATMGLLALGSLAVLRRRKK